MSAPCMGVIVIGTAGDKYTVEVVEHLELVGQTVPNETMSHTDPTNFSIVDEKIKESFQTGPPQPKEERGIISSIGDAIGAALPKIQEFMKGGILGSVPTIVKGLMALVPTTGGSPLIANQGFSYPMLMARQARIDAGLGRGSNVARTEEQQVVDTLVRWKRDNPKVNLYELLTTLNNLCPLADTSDDENDDIPVERHADENPSCGGIAKPPPDEPVIGSQPDHHTRSVVNLQNPALDLVQRLDDHCGPISTLDPKTIDPYFPRVSSLLQNRETMANQSSTSFIHWKASVQNLTTAENQLRMIEAMHPLRPSTGREHLLQKPTG